LFDYVGAGPEFDRALALAPGSAQVQTAFAWYAADLGHFEQAISAARRGVSLDPQNAYAHTVLGTVLYYARQYESALTAFKDGQVLRPSSHDMANGILQTLLASGRSDLARPGCESPNTPMDDDDRHYCLALAYHALGQQSDAESELAKFQALDGDKGAFFYAGVYAQWGNTRAALHWLSMAERLRDPFLWILKVDWHLDPIRNEPEFKAIVARMNFPP
jgi:tetratricopeptide (TPR) repeat protein